MFENLTNKLEAVFKKLRGSVTLNEKNIGEALREVRLALLEADVNFKVVRDFIERVRVRAVGQEVLQSLSPAQQVIKIVNDELITLMSSSPDGSMQDLTPLNLYPDKQNAIMLIGLHGSGKTTACVKLAKHFQKKGFRPLLVAADVYRPAAIKQLETLGKQIQIPVFSLGTEVAPPKIAKKAIGTAQEQNQNLVIIDTAGRLHIDTELMQELHEIKSTISPQEIWLICDAMTGQDAVNVAQQFHQEIGITGVILTKVDGDARGGAVLSIRAVTGAPIRFVGVGEKLDDLELFHPERMASRILGMGDILSLIEKAESTLDAQKVKEMEEKLRKATFTLEDFREQLLSVRKMGSLESLLSMIPGMGNVNNPELMQQSEQEMKKIEAIINSMTPGERLDPQIISGSRRQRIAKGSGTTVQDINRLLKQYDQMRKMFKQFASGSKHMPKFGKMKFGF
ncbi:MAG: signal recognition particle protein [bacterium]|nr:signal recognition particle protein [bacterium]